MSATADRRLMASLERLGSLLRNSARVRPEHFDSKLPPHRARALFREFVELVEIETTSYCNRTCSFCPNATIDRRSEKHTMPEEVWEAILSGLGEVGYDGTLVWSRYSEPLSEERIVERIRQVRSAAPRCRIAINSNGDYLSADYLAMLQSSGLDRLWVDLYLPEARDAYEDTATAELSRFLRRIGRTEHSVVATDPELRCRLSRTGSLKIEITCRNAASIASFLTSRAGLVQINGFRQRTSPCFAPFKHLVIDWDGSVVVCCQMRSDAPSHKVGIIGRLGKEMSLVDSYVKLATWRESLYGFGRKQEPCASCNSSEYPATWLSEGTSSTLTSGAAAPVRIGLAPILSKRTRF